MFTPSLGLLKHLSEERDRLAGNDSLLCDEDERESILTALLSTQVTQRHVISTVKEIDRSPLNHVSSCLRAYMCVYVSCCLSVSTSLYCVCASA